MILYVDIEIDGKPVTAGIIEYESSLSASFTYDADYIAKGYPPISVSLPIQLEPFSSKQTRNFFEGLLPEGFTRRSVASLLRTDEDDYLFLLKALGQECIGAIRIYEQGDNEPPKFYEKLTTDKILKLAEEGAITSAKILTGTRLSLAGASGKVGLAYDGKGDWYLPHGLAPSTHIVKQSHVRLKDIVLNECLVMKTAKYAGLNTSDCFIINLGNGNDGEVLLASKRFDRFSEEPVYENGKFNHIERLHQEDFAQILGINSINKYEIKGGHYLKDMFDVIRKYSANPIEDIMEMWKRLVFDYLIGNTDCHLKNFSMLYGRNLKSMRLTPMYDALSTRIYEETTRDFAFNIGGRYSIEEITRDDFLNASKDAGLGAKKAMDLFDQIAQKVVISLDRATEELTAEGYSNTEKIKDLIVQNIGV